jgi:putative ATP-binding cassette transporter
MTENAFESVARAVEPIAENSGEIEVTARQSDKTIARIKRGIERSRKALKTSKEAIRHPIKALFKSANAELTYEKLVAPYFARPGAKLKLGTIVALNLSTLGSGIVITYLTRNAFNHLTAHDAVGFGYDALEIVAASAGVTGAYSLVNNLSDRFRLDWKNYARKALKDEWLSPNGIRAQILSNTQAEADQRIAADAKSLVDDSFELTIGLTSNSARLAAYSVVLFNLSPTLFVCTAAFCALRGRVTRTINTRKNDNNKEKTEPTNQSAKAQKSDERKRIDITAELNNEAAKAENNYRSQITRMLDNLDKMALYALPIVEGKDLDKKNDVSSGISRKFIRHNTVLTSTGVTFEHAAMMFPLLFMAPKFLLGNSNAEPGDIVLCMTAFHNMRGSLDWYGNAWKVKGEWKANAERLSGFLEALNPKDDPGAKRAEFHPAAPRALTVRNLELQSREGKILSPNVSFDLVSGDRLVIMGPSGCGKTSLFFVTRGVWPHKQGEIHFGSVSDDAGEVIFVPQDPYIPDMELREVFSYPKKGIVFSDDEIIAALTKVDLPVVISKLKEENIRGSDLKLSAGERQRLAFARLLLHKPPFVGLDETTSSLHFEAGMELYRLLSRELPDSIIVSIAHHEQLRELHTHEARFTDGNFVFGKIEEKSSPTANLPVAWTQSPGQFGERPMP